MAVDSITYSFFHVNHSQYLNPSSAAINCTYGNTGAAIFLNLRYPILNSPRVACKLCFGPATSNKIHNATFTHLTLFKFQERFGSIYALQPSFLTITKSILSKAKVHVHVLKYSPTAESSPGHFLTIQETQMSNNGLSNNGHGHSAQDILLLVHCNPNPQQKINTVQLLSSQIIQTVKTDLLTDGLGILIDGCQYVNLVVQFQHLNIGLMINTGFYPKSGRTVQTYFEIRNSSFVINRHTRSVLLLGNVKGQISNSIFSNNFNGLSVVTLTTSLVIFTNCSILNNHNVTGLTVMNIGEAIFEGLNIIQSNSASEGAGIKLLSTSQTRILCIYDNIANDNEGVGGGMYNLLLNKLQLPYYQYSTTLLISENNLCSIPIGSRGSIDFSGNRAVKGESDTYGLKLTDCYVVEYPDSNAYNDYIPIVRTGNIYFNTPLVHFNDTDPLSSMSFDPIIVCFCNETNPLQQIALIRPIIQAYTQECLEINTTIATAGYYDGTSPGTAMCSMQH